MAIALRVIAKLDLPTQAPSDAASFEGSVTKLGPPRPSGCPTNFEMVDMILASAEKEGKDGVYHLPELISEIGEHAIGPA